MLTRDKNWGYVQRCVQNTGVWQTGTQTSCHSIIRAMHTRRAVTIICLLWQLIILKCT